MKNSVLKKLKETDVLFEKHYSIEKSDWKKDLVLTEL